MLGNERLSFALKRFWYKSVKINIWNTWGNNTIEEVVNKIKLLSPEKGSKHIQKNINRNFPVSEKCSYSNYQAEYLSFMENLVFTAYIWIGNMATRTVSSHNT